MSSSSKHQYFSAGITGLLAKVCGKGGGLVSVFLLIRILGAPDYGRYVTVLAGYEIVVIVATLGLDKGISYRVPRLVERGEQRKANLVFFRSLLIALFVSTVVALVAVLAGISAGRMGLKELSFWITGLSPLVTILVLKEVMSEWLISTNRVSQKHIMSSILPRIILLIGLIAAWLRGTSSFLIVVFVLVSSHFIPLVIWGVREISWNFLTKINQVTVDWTYNIRLLFNDVMKESLWRIDLFFVYALLGGTLAGGYKLASKFAKVAKLIDELTTPVFRPRIGEYFEQNNLSALRREYNLLRSISLAGSLSYALGLVVFGAWILVSFGPYRELTIVLWILVYGFGVVVSFGNIGNLLVMDGRSGWVLSASILGLVTNLILNILLIPIIGVPGAAIATIVSLVVQNTVDYWGVKLALNLDMLDHLEINIALGGLILVIFLGFFSLNFILKITLSFLVIGHLWLRWNNIKISLKTIEHYFEAD